jgi:hypothetical protein
LTFADVVWTATAGHPAKPAGQTYLEDPAKTAIYGRNGRPRYGYYQNADIKDANVLLEKTWESLKQTSEPKISISGMVIDLYRLGYHDEPLRLHDTVIVEIKETGETFVKEIIRLDVDLIDPTATRPEIGDYIPNIIYINRDTDKKSGGGGGGGGGRVMTNLEDDKVKAWTEFYNNGDRIGMIVKTRNGDNYIDAPQITLAINDWDDSSKILLKADTIDIDGLITEIATKDLQCNNLNVNGTSYLSDTDVDGDLTCETGYIYGTEVRAAELKVEGTDASWQQYTARYCNMSTGHYFLYAPSAGSTTPSGGVQGYLPTSYTNTTLHYLGYPDS